MNVALYIRTSDSHSDHELERELLYRLAERKQLKVIEVVEDPLEAGTQQQVGLIRLQALAQQRKIHKIYINKLAHLGMRPSQVLQHLEFFHRYGVSFYIHDLGIETLIDTNTLNEAFRPIQVSLAGFPEMEKWHRSGKVKEGLRRARETGVNVGRPLGTQETRKQVIEKYPEVVKTLRKGRSLRYTASMCGVSISTVRKVKKALCSPRPLEQLRLTF